MTRLAERVLTALLADSAIATLVDGRAFPYDIRIAGPSSQFPTVYDAFGAIEGPTMLVVDGGAGRTMSGLLGAYDGRLVVWGLVDGATETGRDDLATLMTRSAAVLIGWQDTESKALLTFGDRRGPIDDPPPDTGVLDRVTFRVGGVHAGIAG
ncbi:MAG TPA: hypothetical protein VFQ54_11930 [Thermomicrobiales bacterium]|nr:hypothetical protein [Thermomicrobiales bacterium]